MYNSPLTVALPQVDADSDLRSHVPGLQRAGPHAPGDTEHEAT